MTEHHMVLGKGKTLQFEHAMTQSWDDWDTRSFVDHLTQYSDQVVYFYSSKAQYYKSHGKMRKHSAKQAINFLQLSGRV